MDCWGSDFSKNRTISLDVLKIVASAENSQEEKDAAEFLNCTLVKFCLPTALVNDPFVVNQTLGVDMEMLLLIDVLVCLHIPMQNLYNLYFLHFI